MASGSYTAETAAESIENKKSDLVTIGRELIANPDWIEKIKNKDVLQEYDLNMLSDLI